MIEPVLLIRADNNNSDQSALAKLGIGSLIDPYLEIRVAEDSEDAQRLVCELEDSNKSMWLLATSVNAFKYWSQIVGESRLRSAISNNPRLRCAAVGERTADVLRNLGARDVLIGGDFTGQSLAEYLVEMEDDGHAVIPGGNIAMKTLPSTLAAAGWAISTGVVYTTSRIQIEPESAQMVREKMVSAVLFRSPSAVRAFTHFVSDPQVALICGGPTSAGALRSIGLNPSAVSPNPSSEVVASTIYSLLS